MSPRPLSEKGLLWGVDPGWLALRGPQSASPSPDTVRQVPALKKPATGLEGALNIGYEGVPSIRMTLGKLCQHSCVSKGKWAMWKTGIIVRIAVISKGYGGTKWEGPEIIKIPGTLTPQPLPITTMLHASICRNSSNIESELLNERRTEGGFCLGSQKLGYCFSETTAPFPLHFYIMKFWFGKSCCHCVLWLLLCKPLPNAVLETTVIFYNSSQVLRLGFGWYMMSSVILRGWMIQAGLCFVGPSFFFWDQQADQSMSTSWQ